jgi:predicted nucleotidyltransferase
MAEFNIAVTRSGLTDPVLERLRKSLRTLYGERLERIVLFGSRARGDAGPDSDYDIAVFLRDLTDRWGEARRLSVIETDILADTGAFVHSDAVPRRFIPRADATDARDPPRRHRSVRPEAQAYLDKARRAGSVRSD